MLAIRMQRTGRKGHAMFRVVVQDSRRTPTSGKVVALLGSYDPHAKTSTLAKDKAVFYLDHGAQPSERVVALFEREGVKLPGWVSKTPVRQGKTRKPEKLRGAQSDEQQTTTPPESSEPAETAAETAAPEPAPAQGADSKKSAEPAEKTDVNASSKEPVETGNPEKSSEASAEIAAPEAEKPSDTKG